MGSKRFTVELLFDVLSPYSYLGFDILTRSCRSWQSMDLKLRPVLLGGIFKGIGVDHSKFNKESKNITSPARKRYNNMEIHRYASFFNVPFQLPADFEKHRLKGSLKAQRLVKAIELDIPEKLQDISRCLSQRVFVRDEDILEDGSLLDACLEVGFSASDSMKLLNRITDDDVKMSLKDSTEKAVEQGVFGVPTYFFDNGKGEKEMFFGTDRLFLLADRLGETWPPKY